MLVEQDSPAGTRRKKQALGFVEEQHGVMVTGGGKGGFDVLGRVAQILGNHGAVIHLVERLADAMRDANRSSP